MATVINTMYPPQIGGSGTFMPAFPVQQVSRTDDDTKLTIDGVADVAFTISQYNSIQDIKGVHVTCVNMSSNMNALEAPTGIYYIPFKDIKKDAVTGQYHLYITTIAHEDIVSAKMKLEDGFTPGTYYKVQLRFDKSGKLDSDGPATDGYLTENLLMFSEWSTVCLIRPIGTPAWSFNGWGDKSETDGDAPSFNKGTIPITGNVWFQVKNQENGNDYEDSTEQLESYQINVYSDTTGELMTKTPVFYCADGKSINYLLDVQGYPSVAGESFHIVVNFTSVNQYSWSTGEEEMPFSVETYARNDDFHPDITVTSETDDGAIRVKVVNTIPVKGYLYIKRASAEDSYVSWETVNVKFVNSTVDYTYDDMTVCSGIFYRYSVQLISPQDKQYTKAYKSAKIMSDFFDAMFYRLGRQMCVRYDFKISSYKPVVNRTKVDTLGGKYPKFVENANMNYKQFSITGLISSQEDPNSRFFKKKDLYGEATSDMFKYNYQNDIRDNYDFFWERGFREELIKWLNDGEPKLMRTMTEGNLCVMLTDISLTPNTTLGRRLYSFTATAYQVEEGMSVDSLVSMGIHDTGEDQAKEEYASTVNPGDIPTVTTSKLGQLYDASMKNEENKYDLTKNVSEIIVSRTLKHLGKGVMAGHKYKAGSMRLRDVKIFFHNRPHIYYVDPETHKLIPHTYNSNNGQLIPPDSHFDKDGKVKKSPVGEALLSGYRITLNGQDIFVNIGGYYQVPSSINVESLSFPDANLSKNAEDSDEVTLEYVVTYDETIESTKDTSTIGMSSYKTVLGQVHGIFNPGERLGDRVYNRYKYSGKNAGDATKINYRMDYWKGLSLEVTPRAVLALEFEDDFTYTEFTVGESGIFHIAEGFPCEDLYFKGVKVFRKKNPPRGYKLPPEEFVLADQGSSNKPGHVYLVSAEDQKMRYYSLDKKWYTFTPVPLTVKDEKGFDIFNTNPDVGIISVPVSGNFNYIGTILKKTTAV